jgi:hypothetical protein
MGFEPVLNVMDRSLNLRDANAECARIIPYPTGRLPWAGAVPGTACQATIASSLRDKQLPVSVVSVSCRKLIGSKILAPLIFLLPSQILLRKRLLARPVGTAPIVAWHEVPGKASPRKNRPVGYGMIGRNQPQRRFWWKCAPCFLRPNTLLERFVSDGVRAAAQRNGPFPEPAGCQR